MDKPTWRATALIIGVTVGVGIYGVPFAFARAGVWVGLAWLIGLAVAVWVYTMMMAEVTLSTQGTHQLAGYASIWLGPWGRRFMTLANVTSIYGALLAFIIVMGQFFHTLLAPWVTVSTTTAALTFGLVASLTWYARPKSLAHLDLWLAGTYALVIGILALALRSHIHLVNLTGATPADWFLPYGIILFALTGISCKWCFKTRIRRSTLG